MAQYRFSVLSPISRGKGQSAVAKAAYNARDAIRDERTGEMKDYSRNNNEVLFSGIFVDPKRNAPEWAQDRAALWNAASAAEKRKDAREAQEIILNLPHELTDQQRRYMLTDFVREQITRSTGRVVDVNIHAAPTNGDDRNVHAHILMSVRLIGPEGFGERLPEVTPEQITRWKEKWAERGAKELRKAGFELEADRWAAGHLTLERQRQAAVERGDLVYAQTLDREPTKHLGPHVAAMDRKGVETDRGNVYRDTIEGNRDLAGLKAELAAIEKQIEAAARETEQWKASREKIEPQFRAAHELVEVQPELEITAPEEIKNRATRQIWEAYQRSDDAKSFVAALQDSGMMLASATKEEARASEIDSHFAKQAGKFAPAYRESEVLVVADTTKVYRLTPRSTGVEWSDIEKRIASLDPKMLQSVESAKQIMQDRADVHEIERQAFRDLSSVGILKREKEPRLGREQAAKEPSARPVRSQLGKGAAAIADFAIDVFHSFVGFFVAPRELTPAEFQSRIEDHLLREQDNINWSRLQKDVYYRDTVAAEQARKVEFDRQREYYQERERDAGPRR